MPRQSDHQPFDEGDVDSLEAKAAARGQRRTSGAKSSSAKITMRTNDIDDVPRLF